MLRTGARRPAGVVAVGNRRIGDRAVLMAVPMAGQEFLTTISGVPEAQSFMIPSRIGAAQGVGGESVADGVRSPSNRPGLLAWQSGSGGLVKCQPPPIR